jgi:exosortase A
MSAATQTLLLSWALLLLLYRQTAWSMVQIWLRSDTFAHGILVLPIVLWLLWRKRQLLGQQHPRPAPAWLALVLLVGTLWLLGELAAVNALTQAALVALLVLAATVLLGPGLARGMGFALAFLFFAVPVGEFLLPQLMEWTANVTVFALRASGIPVLRVGNSFVIPTGYWSVVEACSGVRYLIASFMLGTLFAYLTYQSLYKRLCFVLASLLVPLLANWMRAYFIVLLGHLSGNRLATGVDHLLYGWLFFGLVVGLMFVLGARWAEPQAPTHARLADLPAQPVQPVQPVQSAQSAPPVPGAAPLRATAAGLLLLAALPHLALWAVERRADAQAAAQEAAQATATAVAAPAAAPELGPRWPLADTAAHTPALGAMPAFAPAYQRPTRLWQGLYGPPTRRVGLYVAQYRRQVRGHTLVGSGNALLASNDPQWTLLARASHALQLGGHTLTLATSSLGSANLLASVDQRALQVWQLYWVHGHVTASDFLAKAYSAYARLSGQSDDAAVLLAYAPDEAALAAFWSDNYAALNAWLYQQEAP